MLAWQEVDGDLRQQRAGCVEEAEDDVGRLGGAFDEADVGSECAGLRDLWNEQLREERIAGGPRETREW